MIEPIFNEFSSFPLCRDGIESEERFNTLIHLIRNLEQFGIKKVRYENSINDIPFNSSSTLGEYCSNIIRNRTKGNANLQNDALFLYSRIKKPFIKEEESVLFPDTISQTQYVRLDNENQVYTVVEENPLSISSAYFLNSFMIGFDNNVEKHLLLKLFYSTKNTKGDIYNDSKIIKIVCVCKTEECFTNMEFIELLASQDDLPVPIADHKETKINIPDHHGTKECKEHGKELLANPYVKEILSSRGFDSSEKCYIHKVNQDGSIEIRLYWTSKGYGLLVSTSAQNIVQAYWIAQMLNKKYGN